MPRPRKLKRNGAHLDIYGGIWNSSNTVARTPVSAFLVPTIRSSVRLAGSKDDYIASYDNRLAIANVSGFFGKRQCLLLPYNPIGKNCPMPPAIITPPTARLTSRLRKDNSSQRLMRRGDGIAQAFARPNRMPRKTAALQYV